MSKQNTMLARTNGKFKRVRPFHGMLLGAEDFLDEQSYLRKKIKLQNQLRGDGIVCGLELVANFLVTPYNAKINVTPGLALDCNGNEIVVCAQHTIDLTDQIADLFLTRRAPAGGKGPSFEPQEKILCVGIKYAEQSTEPEAVYTADCGCEEKRCDFSRVQEKYLIKAFAKDAFPWQPDYGFDLVDNPFVSNPWQPFCPRHDESEHYVLLGCIDFSNGKRVVEPEMIKNKRKYVPAHPPSYFWSIPENQLIPKAVVEDICSNAGWKNIAFVRGLKAGDAKEMLTKPPFEFPANNITLTPLDIPTLRLIFRRGADILPFASADDMIDLYYYDDEQQAVLFSLINPPSDRLAMEVLDAAPAPKSLKTKKS